MNEHFTYMLLWNHRLGFGITGDKDEERFKNLADHAIYNDNTGAWKLTEKGLKKARELFKIKNESPDKCK